MSRLVRPQRPVRQIAALWFAAGITVAAVVGFFFDSKQGDARRHMAYDKVRAKGRDLGRWGGKKGRHLRNQAYQDWEEKGIPIPRKYLDPDGRAPWTNPPYPPVAPQPREAKP